MSEREPIVEANHKAHKATLAAYNATRYIAPHMEFYPGGSTVRAKVISAEAMNHVGDSPGNHYRHMIHHDNAASQHLEAAMTLEFNLRAPTSEREHNQRVRSIALHRRAAELHNTLAKHSANKLHIDLGTDRAIRDAIKGNKHKAFTKLVYADWLDEHGLEREARDFRQNAADYGKPDRYIDTPLPISQRAVD